MPRKLSKQNVQRQQQGQQGAPLQRRVALNVLAVLIQCGGADDLRSQEVG